MTYQKYQPQIEGFVSRNLAAAIVIFLFGIKLGMNDNGPLNQAWILGGLPLCVLMLPALRSDAPFNRILEWLGDRSFGIFFLHAIVTDRIVSLFSTNNHVGIGLLMDLSLTIGYGLIASASNTASAPTRVW